MKSIVMGYAFVAGFVSGGTFYDDHRGWSETIAWSNFMLVTATLLSPHGWRADQDLGRCNFC